MAWSTTARIERPRHPSKNSPSKQACFCFLGMAPVLVPLRPSSEHILIVRAPGARDQHGCQSNLFYRGGSVSTGDQSGRKPFSLEFLPSPLEFLPISQLVARISLFVYHMILTS